MVQTSLSIKSHKSTRAAWWISAIAMPYMLMNSSNSSEAVENFSRKNMRLDWDWKASSKDLKELRNKNKKMTGKEIKVSYSDHFVQHNTVNIKCL